MTSIRHTSDAVLDAVRECVLAVGVRRTTLTDVARRAGVSRMTLYRRYPDVDALVRDLMTREFGALLREAGERACQGQARERVTAGVVAAAAAVRRNELFRRVVDVDPELLLPYLTDRLGSTQWMTIDYLIEGIDAGQQDGTIRGGDVRAIAHGALLLIQPFVYSARLVEGVLDDGDLDAELARILDRYLAP